MFKLNMFVNDYVYFKLRGGATGHGTVVSIEDNGYHKYSLNGLKYSECGYNYPGNIRDTDIIEIRKVVGKDERQEAIDQLATLMTKIRTESTGISNEDRTVWGIEVNALDTHIVFMATDKELQTLRNRLDAETNSITTFYRMV